jgi:site-specific DNA-methyltransferase (adenine-specific)
MKNESPERQDIPLALRNQIICCDCVEAMKQLPDCCIPLTVTSPPYDDLREYGGHPFDFQAIATELFRITMPGGMLVWVVAEAIRNGSLTGTSSEQRLFFRQIGFGLYADLVMGRYGSRMLTPNRYEAPEYAFVLSKGRPRYVNLLRDKPNKRVGTVTDYRGRHKDGSVRQLLDPRPIRPFGRRQAIWSYGSGGCSATDKIAFDHPALMPEKMAEDHIISWSRPGDLVFDPMCGAGTTCKMALLNDRNYLGYEVVPRYWEIAQKRLRMAEEEYRGRLDEFVGI